MTLFDLLFLAIFLATAIALIYAAYCSLRGRFAQAGKVVLGAAIFWAIYLTIVIVVSLTTPRRVVAIGEERCFDDWCITVARVATSPSFAVTLKVTSEAKRVWQGAPSTSVYLEDVEGRKYQSKSENGQPLFAKKIGPGESFETVREFEIPANVKIAGLVVKHGTGPPAMIIGEDGALFHKPAIVKF